MEQKEKIKLFQDWLTNSNNIVFFGGAGVSTESGLPDFRSQDGLYSMKYDYPPETILSASFFKRYPDEFYRFYKDKMLILSAKPNRAHFFLAELEKKNKLKALITQNIDGLHQKAGSQNVIELHGSIHHNHCLKCHKEYDAEFIKNSKEIVPHCPSCGGIIKPDVVLYEEPLDETFLFESLKAIQQADVLIVAGTSLSVFPASSLVPYYQKDKLVVINKTKIAIEERANLVFHSSICEILSEVHA